MRFQRPPSRKARLAATARRLQLVSIAMGQIATKGFEGLRFQEVAKQAGINNATLSYHFSTKEALIQGVVNHLTEELKKTRSDLSDAPMTVLQELRLEFDDFRKLLRAKPKLFIVLIELSLRGLRGPAINMMEKNRDGLWRDHLTGMIRRGMKQGVFRRGIRAEAVAVALMAQFKGLGYHATLGKRNHREVDQVIAEVERQVEHWLVCGSTDAN